MEATAGLNTLPGVADIKSSTKNGLCLCPEGGERGCSRGGLGALTTNRTPRCAATGAARVVGTRG
jgi:hypothetical protein